MKNTKTLSRTAVLTALALALSAAESLIPLRGVIPIPGLKLGLANLVTTFALCRLNPGEALLILICRCFLGSLMGGRLTSLAFSLTGGLFAFLAMFVFIRCPGVSLFGVSVAGAAAHNFGQIIAACVVLSSTAPITYLPALLICSVVTGAVTGGVSMLLVRRIPVSLLQ